MTETKYHQWQDWLDRIAVHLLASGTHAARCVVLLPYAQLMPVAERLWGLAWPQGFVPRFETTLSWSRSLGGVIPAANDISFDTALDVLTARALLTRVGLGDHADLAGRLMEAAHQLGPLAAAVPPSQRVAWGGRTRAAALSGLEGEALKLESALAQTAVAWAASSAYVTDVLFESGTLHAADCLIVLQGLQADPLTDALQSVWGERMSCIAMNDGMEVRHTAAKIDFHQARDAPDEAQRAAACVLLHVNAGHVPVALVATDRSLTRRVRALLEGSGLSLRDENGWKLSTSRSGAHAMGALRACAWNASSDSVLDWLKNAPAFDAAAVRWLEARLRRDTVREWRDGPGLASVQEPAQAELLQRVQTLREGLQRARSLPLWLLALRELLQHSGQWALLQDDAAGEKLISVLRLSETVAPEWQEWQAASLWAGRALSLTEFTQWVNQSLEAASFVPAYPENEQVVILPLSQMLGRPFAAAVLPGCDELRLNPSPEPPGLWSAAQRLALGLPAREALAAAQRAAWHNALQTPQVELLWRVSDDGGEPLLPSPLVQVLRLKAGYATAPDPRPQREIAPAPIQCPAPAAPMLTIERLSASAYEDLRRCPYRFFALRLLGLKESDELESELGKRDFGLWLHAVLKVFHDRLKQSDTVDAATRRGLLDAAAREVTDSQRLAEDEFLPFLAAWPQVRDGYLDWLLKHEATGARFDEAESWQELPLGLVTLVGRVDRIDQMPDGGVMVIDYKTEPLAQTRDRIKSPTEDTQLAFYAALQPHDTLRAAYVNVGEREGSKLVEQTDVVAVRDELIEGIRHDMARIAQGAPLPALGEGMACEFCAARGLCRKDFWEGA